MQIIWTSRYFLTWQKNENWYNWNVFNNKFMLAYKTAAKSNLSDRKPSAFYLASDRCVLLNYVNVLILCWIMYNL